MYILGLLVTKKGVKRNSVKNRHPSINSTRITRFCVAGVSFSDSDKIS